MNPTTLQALAESVRHWSLLLDATVNGIYVDLEHLGYSSDDCPLCQVFAPKAIQDDCGLVCRGCPIFEETGKLWCGGTPYEDAQEAFEEFYFDTDFRGSAQEAAQNELNFLRALLPEPSSDHEALT